MKRRFLLLSLSLTVSVMLAVFFYLRIFAADVPPENFFIDRVFNEQAVISDRLPEDYQDICIGNDHLNFDCYETYFAAFVAERGIKAAFVDLKMRYAPNEYVKSQCHPLTHVIGRVAADQFSTPAEAYAEGDPFCWSGYYHGVLEGVIGKIGLSKLPKMMNSICDSIPGKASYSFDYYNCLHGLGHGVMAITNDELFKALEYCDNLHGSWEQSSCASGAFMENVIIDGKNHFTKYLDPERPLYPCSESPEKYKTTCYLMQTSYMLKINNSDFRKTFEWCKGAGEQYQNTCYSSLGRDASGRSVSDAKITKATCLLGEKGDQQTYCVIGAVKDFVSYFHSDTEAKELCISFEDEALRLTCLATVTDYYRAFSL